MFPSPCRKLATLLTLVALGGGLPGGLTGCCSNGQDQAKSTASVGSDFYRKPEYVPLTTDSNTNNGSASALGVAGLDAVLFVVSALTGGHPLAPDNDSGPSAFDPPPR